LAMAEKSLAKRGDHRPLPIVHIVSVHRTWDCLIKPFAPEQGGGVELEQAQQKG
jgi:hypothetical protein